MRTTGLIAGLLLLSLLMSCQRGSRKYLIPEKKFINVLVDLHLVEAIGRKLNDPDQPFRPDSASLYGSVFGKYGVTYEMFDSTMNYYSRRPEKFQEIYNAATAKLRHMEEDVLNAMKKEEETEDAEVLWDDVSLHRFPPLQGDRIEISVPLKGPGIYVVSARIKMLPEDLSLTPRMSVYFFRESERPGGDRIPFDEVMYTDRTGKERNYRAVKRLDNPQFNHLKGYIVNYSNTDTLFNRSMVVLEIKVSMLREKELKSKGE